MMVGSVLWLNDAAKKSEAVDGNGVSVTAGDLESVATRPPPPFPFRLGASYAGGFLFGWALRRFLKTTAGSWAPWLPRLRCSRPQAGWISTGLPGNTTCPRHFAWIESQAGGIKQFLFGFLPSAGAAGTGLFLGFRRS